MDSLASCHARQRALGIAVALGGVLGQFALAALDFLSEPASFFYDGTRPIGAEEVGDPFRRGLLLIARATSEAELTAVVPARCAMSSSA
ncbi:hypothetical protein [Kitasatospora sp. A2-31]|uniref:hypothetical protein n=1 Tax=Kitasatospora sp. A2-31 TaxID=2916414 RepID=UPI001EEA36DE|nr:hypothetical protein [Kitasatospora sp. A2-31]MCG6498184.1 hypothetical protein [Kitasatospora sp. A2-31]